MMSCTRRLVRLAAISAASASDTTICSSGACTASPGISPTSSFSSLGVHAACTGPRRATRHTERRGGPALGACASRASGAASAASACDATSVTDSALGSCSSTRAQSSATLPIPHTATLSTRRRSTGRPAASGCPLYHHTNSRALNTFLAPSPGMPSRLSLSAPYASTTPWYSVRRSCRDTCLPSVTPPKNETRGSLPRDVNWLITFFVSWWSGATPERTSPKGLGRRSTRST
mmetsp:Transcript_2022/g.5128  ORF Transcript_2022/g.5128 Transcript_2022/m.5128 type:complete len:233 (-) Transcript_2022:161-859(-)